MNKTLYDSSIYKRMNLKQQNIYYNALGNNLAAKPFPLNFAVHLCSQDDFFVCPNFTDDVVGPPTVLLKERTYYRFMKFIYLPQPPENLHSEQVIKVCDFRLDHMDQLVDIKFNDHAIEIMAAHIRLTLTNTNSWLKVLDFGCGSGLSSQLLLNYLPNLDIIGMDISNKAIHYCREQAFSAIHSSLGEPFPFETASFDLIFAAFVMHFNIDTLTLTELRRVLRPQGKFVFNVYQQSIDSVVQRLQRAGFDSFEVWNNVYGAGVNYGTVSSGISTF